MSEDKDTYKKELEETTNEQFGLIGVYLLRHPIGCLTVIAILVILAMIFW